MTRLEDKKLMHQLGGCVTLSELQEVEPGYILGTLSILGTDHHFELIQVVEDSQTGEQHPTANELNWQRYDEMQTAYDGIYRTVWLDGRQFVCRVHPYCR
jgi:hypothetical protein